MKYFKRRVALGGSSINTWWSDRSHLLERGRDDYLHFHTNTNIQKYKKEAERTTSTFTETRKYKKEAEMTNSTFTGIRKYKKEVEMTSTTFTEIGIYNYK